MLARLRAHIEAALRLPQLEQEVARLRFELDTVRSRRDLPPDLPDRFLGAKQSHEYGRPYDAVRPLVTVGVGTYNRRDLLVQRCLRSLLAQTYDNLEIIVVGDGCTDGTGDAVADLRDPRIRFENLPSRGPYPDDPELRWMVAGTMPMNRALSLATGDFVTHLDDDDEHSSDRVEKLLHFMRETRADLVYHPFQWERQPGRWQVNPAREFRWTQVTTSSIFYHRWLACVPWDASAYTYR
jgi:hypothetical protein